MSFLDFGLSSWPGSGNREPEYGMEFGSVTLKRIGFFVFQLNTQHTLRGNVIISKAARKRLLIYFTTAFPVVISFASHGVTVS